MTLKLTQLYLCALPFLFAVSALTGGLGGIDIHTARIVPILLLCTLFFDAVRNEQKIIFPLTPISLIIISFFLWSTLSLLYSPVPEWTMRKLFFFVTFAPLFIVLPTLAVWHKDNFWQKTIGALVKGCGIISLVGIMQFLLQFPLSLDGAARVWSVLTPFFLGATFSESVAQFNSWYVNIGGVNFFRAIAFFPDPHIFAYYTGMILPLAFAQWRLVRSSVLLFFVLCILLANILTFSRGGEVALLAGLSLLCLIKWKKISLKGKHAIFALILVLVGILLIPQNPLSQRFSSSFDQTDTSNTSRIALWQDAVETISQYPVRGVGLGAYGIIVDPRATYRTPIYAHNTLLDISVETGLIGGGLFILLILLALCSFVRSHNYWSSYVMISLGIFSIHGIFDTPLFSVHIFPLLTILLSFALTYEHTEHTEIRTSRNAR